MRRYGDLDAKGLLDARGGQRFGRRPFGEDAPAGEQGDAVRVLRGEVEVVQDYEDADAFSGELEGDAQDAVLVGMIEARGGLVEQEVSLGSRAACVELAERPREVDALLLAARERGVEAIVEACEPDTGERVTGDG